MGKIVATIGISASGKSTFANEMAQANPKLVVVVNRDKIRELLFGYTEKTIANYYHRDDLGKLEKQVTKYEDTLINEALAEDKTVIVDATHLKRKYIERLKYWNVPINLQWFDITLKEALIRNQSRDRQVDENIIIAQHNNYIDITRSISENPIDLKPVKLIQDLTNDPCYIFDIDGTLAHMQNRSPYDWSKVGEDTIDLQVAEMMDGLSRLGNKIIICTGRDGSCIDATEKWLRNYKVKYDEIYIREAGDMNPDWVIKEEMWRDISKDNLIMGLVDDRLQVVRRARALGLKVFNVAYNNF